MRRELLTPEGYARLEAELKHHREVLRPQVIEELEVARAHGDLSENAEYDYAKDKQGMIEARIVEYNSTLARAEVIDVTKMPGGERVIFGATVDLMDVETEEELRYRVVGRSEADVKKGKISYDSPLGKALIGKEEGEELQFVTPRGYRTLEVLAVRYE